MLRQLALATILTLLTVGPSTANEQLDASWQQFIQGLQQAQQSLSDPEYLLAEPSGRNLAEGYRYMLGHLNRFIESEIRLDTNYPEFFRSVDMLRKWTGENPDAMYLKAPIDASGYYRIFGTISSTGSAPNMVTFQTVTDNPGSTGELAEMALCKNQTLDFLNSFDLKLNQDSAFEILIGPERPADHRGLFLSSRKAMLCPATGQKTLRDATALAVREIFSDWAREVPLEMEIVRVDSIGKSRPPISAEFMSAKLEKIATELPNQVRFWQLLQNNVLEVNNDFNGDGRRNLPYNGINSPAPPFTAGGVAGAEQLYAAGVFELSDKQALIVKVTAPVEPRYMGFQLNNLWFEGPDQQNYVSSLSGHQLALASDDSRYFIVSHRDPGVQGWVATTGLIKGVHAMRFLFEAKPVKENMPSAEAVLVKFNEIGKHIPTDTPKVSPEQRQQQIAIRQSHIKRRWRAH
jgi:hypothetical protein